MFPSCCACLLSPFHAEMLRLGGPERISVLLIFARTDHDSSGEIDDQELVEYRRAGELLVANTSNQASTLGVVAALMLTATHLTTIGRPTPLAVSEDFTQAHGERASDAVHPVAQPMRWLRQEIGPIHEVRARTSRPLRCKALRGRRVPWPTRAVRDPRC